MKYRIKKVTESNHAISPYYIPQVKEHWWSWGWEDIVIDKGTDVSMPTYCYSVNEALSFIEKHKKAHTPVKVEYFSISEAQLKALDGVWFAPTVENMKLFHEDDVFLVKDHIQFGLIDIARYKGGKWVKFPSRHGEVTFTPREVQVIERYNTPEEL